MGIPLLSSTPKGLSIGSPNHISPSPSPSSSPSPSPSRLWRLAAQRNIRNQWSKLLSSKERWLSAASQGTSHGTDFVNSYLNLRKVPAMDLGALMDMPGIRERSCDKLAHMQELCRRKFLSSYKDMVDAVTILVKAYGSMRCYLRGPGFDSIIQYCNHLENPNDFGDGGGIPVFSCLSISILEDMAREVVDMFLRELSLKRLFVIELLSMTSVDFVDDRGKDGVLSWSDELYPGEFDDLRSNGMIRQDSCHPITPQIMDWPPSDPISRTPTKSTNLDNFQVILCGWITHVNIEMQRIDEIFSIVEEEIQSKLS